jgi:aryl-alcohol dehydrogenase-like predicted oxidoreductase
MGGGNWEWSWGPQDDSDSVHAIYEGLESGMNWIDTAAAYGLGHSEAVVRRALKDMPGRAYVFTKCSLVWDESGQISHNLQAASIRRELEGSLQRLDVEQIDLYQIHWPAWMALRKVPRPVRFRRLSALSQRCSVKARFDTSASRISMRDKGREPWR